jgi:excisionase family DNA binding protein
MLTVAQAAESLCTSERFVRGLVAQRRVRFYRMGHYVRFDTVDLDTFIQAGRVESRAPDVVARQSGDGVSDPRALSASSGLLQRVPGGSCGDARRRREGTAGTRPPQFGSLLRSDARNAW